MTDKDLFVSEMAITCLKKLTPEDISDYIESYDAPKNHIIITDHFSADYLMNKFDFKDTSRLLKYDEPFMAVEYFENGIPEWLDPVPGTRIYLAEWNGTGWDLTKVSGI